MYREKSLNIEHVLEENHAPSVSEKVHPLAQRCSACCCLFLLQGILGSATRLLWDILPGLAACLCGGNILLHGQR